MGIASNPERNMSSGGECVGEGGVSLVLFIYLANFCELSRLMGRAFQTLPNIVLSNRNLNKD